MYKLGDGLKRTSIWASTNMDPLKRKRQQAYLSLGPQNIRLVKTSRPMPERIRISSPFISSILDSMAMDGINTNHHSLWKLEERSGRKECFIMVRPFRALAYLRTQLYQLYESMKRELLQLSQSRETTLAPDIPPKQASESGEATAKAGGLTPSSTGKDTPGTEPDTPNVPSSCQSLQNEPTKDDTKFKHLKCLMNFMTVDIDE